jgi:hypothetical protein
VESFQVEAGSAAGCESRNTEHRIDRDDIHRERASWYLLRASSCDGVWVKRAERRCGYRSWTLTTQRDQDTIHAFDIREKR